MVCTDEYSAILESCPIRNMNEIDFARRPCTVIFVDLPLAENSVTLPAYGNRFKYCQYVDSHPCLLRQRGDRVIHRDSCCRDETHRAPAIALSGVCGDVFLRGGIPTHCGRILYGRNDSRGSLRTALANHFPDNFLSGIFYLCRRCTPDSSEFKPWLAFITLLYGGMLVFNWTTPYSLRFDTLEMIEPLRLSWGETLARFSGTAGLGNGFFRAVTSGVIIWVLWRSVVQYRRGERRMALFLAACQVLLIAAGVWGSNDRSWADRFFLCCGIRVSRVCVADERQLGAGIA